MLLLHLVFRSWTESDQVSVNDIFTRLETRHNSAIGGWIDNPLITLVSQHVISSRGLSPPRFHGPVTPLCIGFLNQGFSQFPSMQLLHWNQRKFQFKIGLPKIIQIPCHHVLANQNALKFKKGEPLKQSFHINLGICIIRKTTFFVCIFDISPCVFTQILIEKYHWMRN